MARNRGVFGVNNSKQAQTETIDPQEVALVAYRLYEERGRADGYALEDWLKAEAIVREQSRTRQIVI